jgi:catechol 2,3-dioxygenase
MNMIPVLKNIDHVHVYVRNRDEVEQWYQQVLGFSRMQEFQDWAVGKGPLMLENRAGSVHLALFESDAGPNSTIAFGATGEEFMAWKAHLEAQGLELQVKDHDLAWSLYFDDPCANHHEITTYDHALVASQLG